MLCVTSYAEDYVDATQAKIDAQIVAPALLAAIERRVSGGTADG